MAKHHDLSALAKGLHDLLEPPPAAEEAGHEDRPDDEAHASGHRHVGPPPEIPMPPSVRQAPVRGDRTGHPGRQH